MKDNQINSNSAVGDINNFVHQLFGLDGGRVTPVAHEGMCGLHGHGQYLSRQPYYLTFISFYIVGEEEQILNYDWLVKLS